MSKAERPWMKFYPADWRSDPGLRLCSFAARGLWVDLLSLMHEGNPYGHLLLNGKKPDAKQIASLLSAQTKDVARLLTQLESAAVFSRTDDGVIFSRRMVRDLEKLNNDKENGKGGGNPRLKGGDNPPDNQQVNAPVNPPDKPRDNGGLKAHMLDARSQKLEKEESKKEAPGAIAPPEPVYMPLHMVRAINGDWRTILYQQGLDWLSRHEGKRPNELRSLIGLWLKRSGDDAKAVFDLLAECDLRKVAAPIDWITKALQAKSKPRVELSPDIVPSSDLAAPASWGDG